MSDETPSRISVSRDALRAELAEMELRLRIYFDDQLKHKAESAHLAELALKFDRLDRGEWSDTHRRALEELIQDTQEDKTDQDWSRRQRVQGLIAGVLASTACSLSIILAFKGGL